MTRQTVQFKNDAGHTLAGTIYGPASNVRAAALFAHCFTCSRRSKAAVSIARALARAGFAVMTFDFTGIGDSGGEFPQTSFTTRVEDLVAAARFLETAVAAPALLIGHSFGGTAALAAAGRIPSCRAVATLAAPARPGHVRHVLGDAGEAALERDGTAVVRIGERPFKISREFLEDLERQSVPERLRELRCALMVMHAPLDPVVPIDNATEIFTHALHPKSFVSLDDAGHLLDDAADAEYAARVLAAWASRYVESPPEQAGSVDSGVVARTGPDTFTTEVAAGGHALVVDEPASLGGADLGPTPYGLLSAALAACSSMTMQMYARRKQWPLEEASVRVEHARVHAEDCADCTEADTRIERFTREISMTGELDAEQRARLLEIADRCPIHRTLTGRIRIVTRGAQDGSEPPRA